MTRACMFCDLDGEEPSAAEFLRKLKHCTNCKADIAMRGQWTGDGWRALLRLWERAEAAVDQLPTPTSESRR